MDNILHWSDAHAHLGMDEELAERERLSMLALLCAANPPEAQALFRRLEGRPPCLIPTCGLHPWSSDRFSTAEMEPWLDAAPVVGEIGMDSVWCDIPLSIQEDVFCWQLAYAVRQNKPVILHTKGQEKRIASILAQYANCYLVHWYSCETHLEDYLALDCYFSIGPDVIWNPAVQRTAQAVPLNRLLVETDGMDAVRWAYEQAPVQGGAALTVPLRPQDALRMTLLEVSRLRGLPVQTLARQVWENLNHFTKGTCSR